MMGMQFARHDNKQDLDDGHDNKQDLNDAMLWQGASMEAISSGVGVLQRIDSYPLVAAHKALLTWKSWRRSLLTTAVFIQ
jgi:hypothetical protein